MKGEGKRKERVHIKEGEWDGREEWRRGEESTGTHYGGRERAWGEGRENKIRKESRMGGGDFT